MVTEVDKFRLFPILLIIYPISYIIFLDFI